MSFLVNALNELDPNFIRSVGTLHSTDGPLKHDSLVALQKHLEEEIKAKTGVVKDYTYLVQSCLQEQQVEEFKPIVYDESKGSNSDNELELDLLKDDLMCVICHEMDVGVRNRLVECSDCHALYHQECHTPVVSNQESFDSWVCQKCKDANKRAKLSKTEEMVVSPVQHCGCDGNSICVICSPKQIPSSSHRHSSSSSMISSSSSSHKVSSSSSSSSKSSDKYAKPSSSSSTVKSSSSSISSSSNCSTSKPSSSMGPPRTTITPNINIISADKRLQIMKKKAAKLQEKRKQLPR